MQTFKEIEKELDKLNITNDKREITKKEFEKIKKYHSNFLKTYDETDIQQQLELQIIEEYLDENQYIIKDKI